MNPVVFDTLEDLRLELGMQDAYDVDGPWLDIHGLTASSFERAIPFLPAAQGFAFSADVEPSEHLALYPGSSLRHSYDWGFWSASWQKSFAAIEFVQLGGSANGHSAGNDLSDGFRHCLAVCAGFMGKSFDDLFEILRDGHGYEDEFVEIQARDASPHLKMSLRNPGFVEDFPSSILAIEGPGHSAAISQTRLPLAEFTAFPGHKSLQANVFCLVEPQNDHECAESNPRWRDALERIGDDFESFSFQLMVCPTGKHAGTRFRLRYDKNRNGGQTTYLDNFGAKRASPGTRKALMERIGNFTVKIGKGRI